MAAPLDPPPALHALVRPDRGSGARTGSLTALLSTWLGLPDEMVGEARGQVRRFAVAILIFVGINATGRIATVVFGLGTWDRERAIPLAGLVALIACAGLLAACRSPRISNRTVAYLGLAGVVFFCGLSTCVHAVHQVHLYGSVTPFGPHTILIPTFPLLMPVTPRLTLITASSAAALGYAGLVVGLGAAGQRLAELRGAILMDLASVPLACVVFAYVGSRMLLRLHADVVRARRMGSYELEEKLGAGGMGEVWRARHHMLASPAAIKLIRLDGDLGLTPDARRRALERFSREAKATALLGSPSTVRLYDFGVTDDGTFYYAMELLEGIDLYTLVADHGPQPPERVIAILLQACDSLAEAHERGLVHRDIKPANIMLCRQGRSLDVVKVLDFGIVGVQAGDGGAGLARGAEPSLTQPGLLLGTPAYMAPEALTGEACDVRSDIYALGCVAYWLLTGRRVFEATSHAQLIACHLRDPVAPPSVERPGVPADLESAVMACLAKAPGDRPPSADALADRLRACAGAQAWDAGRARAWWSERPAAARRPAPPPIDRTATHASSPDDATLRASVQVVRPPTGPGIR